MDALHRLGLTPAIDAAAAEHRAAGLRLARVAAQHRGGYVVLTTAVLAAAAVDGEAGAITELRADLSGRLRRAVAIDAAAGPAVGDWVAVEVHGEERPSATMHTVLPRASKLSRKAVGRGASEQLVAANVDTVFLVCPLDQPLNLRRIERLLTIALESGAAAVIVLTKADLCADPDAALAQLGPRPEVPVHVISNVTGVGVDALDIYTDSPRTSALIGASGVGKSTLINRWLGHARQAVNAVRDDGKGRHTTTHRELLVLPQGGLVIDTPGMRELGLWRSEEGLQGAFADVAALTGTCRFRDCTHAQEPGCAIHAAVADGTLAPERAASFIKLQQEQAILDRERDGLARLRARQADRRSQRALNKVTRKQ